MYVVCRLLRIHSDDGLKLTIYLTRIRELYHSLRLHCSSKIHACFLQDYKWRVHLNKSLRCIPDLAELYKPILPDWSSVTEHDQMRVEDTAVQNCFFFFHRMSNKVTLRPHSKISTLLLFFITFFPLPFEVQRFTDVIACLKLAESTKWSCLRRRYGPACACAWTSQPGASPTFQTE